MACCPSSPTRWTNNTCRARPATACPPPPPAARSPSPTSSTPWSVSSPSANCRAATKIRSRRAALGALRIFIECALPLDLESLLKRAAHHYGGVAPAGTVEAVLDFMMERLRGYYLDAGIRPDVFEAVLAGRPTCPYDFDRRIRAVAAFRERPEAASLAAANKRIRNILKQADAAAIGAVDEAALAESAERSLHRELTALRAEVTQAFDAGDYTAALRRLASLREAVDAFFDTVMVLTDDIALRTNRVALLAALHGLFSRAADLSRLQ